MLGKNDKNPSGYQEVERIDTKGKPHKNPNRTIVPTPHKHTAGQKDVIPLDPKRILCIDNKFIKMNSIAFFQDWYMFNCNGDWEHNFGIKIETLDNPGWYVVIDLEDTQREKLVFYESNEKSESDWFTIKVLNKQLIASGDASKLIFLLNRIQEILS